MLLKARPAAGNLRLGNHFLNLLTPRIYSTTTDFSQIERLAETRDRIQQNRKRSGQGVVDVKLDPGGIRDIEFLVQCLQRLYGGKDSFLRSGGTMHALHRFAGERLPGLFGLQRLVHGVHLTANDRAPTPDVGQQADPRIAEE